MQPILSAKNLTKKFREFTAVDAVSFEIGEGEKLSPMIILSLLKKKWEPWIWKMLL